MPDCLLTAPPRPGLRHVENPAIPVHFVRNPRDDNPVKSASRYIPLSQVDPQPKGIGDSSQRISTVSPVILSQVDPQPKGIGDTI